jgi:hypothetical protein
MRPRLAKLYTDNYTEAELRDIIAFYQTPTGQVTVQKMPIILQETLSLAMAGVQANMAEFQRRVGVLIQDYQKKAAQSGQVPGAAGTAPAIVTVPTAPPK